MITEVSIKNIALADRIEFELRPGLNVFTGETGAGKSLVISAIAFAFGMSSGIVKLRDERESAQVTVTIDPEKIGGIKDFLDESGVDDDGDDLIIQRTISTDGKTKNHLNGVKVSVSTLQKLGRMALEISGQNDELLLLEPRVQLDLLDRYCGSAMAKLREEISEKHRALKALAAEREALMTSESERAREIDLFSYQVNEIREADLDEDEEEELAERIGFLKNAENIAKMREEIISILDGGDGPSVIDGVGRVSGLIEKLAAIDKNFEQMSTAVNDAYYSLKDASSEVEALSDRLDYSENELNELLERQHFISSLKRKYGATIADILAYLETAEKKLSTLKNFEENFSTINQKIEKAFEDYSATAAKITKLRESKKGDVDAAVTAELVTLDMKNAIFQIAIKAPAERNIASAGPLGFESVEFMVRTNPGMPMTPIAKTASGGEMSRIMLAIKKVLSAFSEVPSIIFDEIDTGIGGFTLNAVGEKLRAIASSKQVICITHSPIIASFSQSHFLVGKEVVGGERTVIGIRRLASSEVEGEIARMLGNDSEIGISHARELISKNRANKNDE